jgi:hypothetical protein
MSIEVRVPEEIYDYKESIIAGLSLRQLICGGIAMAMGLPAFFLLKDINEDLATYVTMAVVIPAFCVGFIKKDGYNFETFAKIRLYSMFSKSKRTYETNPEENEIPVESEEYRLYKDEKEIKRGENNVRQKNKKVKNRTIDREECEFVEISEKNSERKRKAIYQSLAKAKRNNRKEKPKKEKTAEGRSFPKERTTDIEI